MTSVADFAAYLWIPFITSLGAIVTIFFVAWLVQRYVKDPEVQLLIGRAVFILTALVLFGFLFSALQTASVHLPRTTIDRSLSDEQQDALEKRVYQPNGETK